MKKSQYAILHLLGCTLNGVEIDKSIFANNSDKFWSNFYQQAYDQCVAALVLDSIEKLPKELLPPLEVKLRLVYLRDKTEKLYPVHLDAIQKIKDMLKTANLESYILKGTDIAKLYEMPSHRKLGDIDIYIPEYKKAYKVFEDNGIKVEKWSLLEKHDKFTFNNIEVELHKKLTDLTPTYSNIRRRDYLVNNVGNKAKFYGVFLLIHKIRHLTKRGIKLHLIADWNQYIKQYGVQYICDFNDKQLLKFANAFNYILIQYFGLSKEYLKKSDGTYLLPSEEEQIIGEEIIATCFKLNETQALKGFPRLGYEIKQYYHYLGLTDMIFELSWTFCNQILRFFKKIV